LRLSGLCKSLFAVIFFHSYKAGNDSALAVVVIGLVVLSLAVETAVNIAVLFQIS
jgi:hypothetical protein